MGCQKKKEDPASLPVENTTHIEEKKTPITISTPTPIPLFTPSPTPTPVISTSLPRQKKPIPANTFTLQSLEDNIYTVTINDNRCSIKESDKAITILTFFTTWCPPCMTQLSYLDDLQKRYTKDMLLCAILINDPIQKNALKALLLQKHIFCFTAYGKENTFLAKKITTNLQLSKNFPIPLTVIYVKGNYFTHYEGIVPIEMIEYDIKEAQKLLQ